MIACRVCAMSTRRGTVSGSPPSVPFCNASFSRATPLALALGVMSLLKLIASDLSVSPPAIASTWASDMSSMDSLPVIRVMSSFSTRRSRLWLSLRVLTRY